MFAIVEIKGKQYKVQKGSIIDVDLIEQSSEKNTLIFSEILALFDEETSQFGTPHIKNSSIEFEILEEIKDKKVTVFKFKRKTGYKKTQGHRQRYTRLRVKSINNKITKPKTNNKTNSTESKKNKETKLIKDN